MFSAILILFSAIIIISTVYSMFEPFVSVLPGHLDPQISASPCHHQPVTRDPFLVLSARSHLSMQFPATSSPANLSDCVSTFSTSQSSESTPVELHQSCPRHRFTTTLSSVSYVMMVSPVSFYETQVL